MGPMSCKEHVRRQPGKVVYEYSTALSIVLVGKDWAVSTQLKASIRRRRMCLCETAIGCCLQNLFRGECIWCLHGGVDGDRLVSERTRRFRSTVTQPTKGCCGSHCATVSLPPPTGSPKSRDAANGRTMMEGTQTVISLLASFNASKIVKMR